MLHHHPLVLTQQPQNLRIFAADKAETSSTELYWMIAKGHEVPYPTQLDVWQKLYPEEKGSFIHFSVHGQNNKLQKLIEAQCNLNQYNTAANAQHAKGHQLKLLSMQDYKKMLTNRKIAVQKLKNKHFKFA